MACRPGEGQGRRSPAGTAVLDAERWADLALAGPVCDARAVRPTLFEFAGGEPAFLALAMPRWSWDGLQAGASAP